MSLESTLTMVQQVVTIVIIPVIGALTPSVIKLINTHINSKQWIIAETIAKTAIHSIEQQYPELAGEKKYLMAAQKINKELGNKLTPKQVDDLIESAVKQMNITLGKISVVPKEPMVSDKKDELQA